MAVQTFRVNIPQMTLDDLKRRLAQTRLPDEVKGAGWDYGTNLDYLKSLVDYWQNQFDWRAQEEKINRFAQFRTEIDGFGIHFIHERGKGPRPIPIIIIHGWPGTFFEICKLIPLLTDPESHGGDPADSFDVIVPSLPGFGFSNRPLERGMMSSRRIAGLWANLMTEDLGYERFAAAGGDFGSIVTQYLAEEHPELLTGIHLIYIGHYASTPDPSELSEAEKRYRSAIQQWSMREGGYYMIQSTKPHPPRKLEPLPAVPAAFASFPGDLNPLPREWVERRLHLLQWTEMPRGGLFAAMEEPELLAEDIMRFFHNRRQLPE